MAVAFCQQIFKIKPPLGFGYEFFLIGGKKMSSSKGLGSIAAEVAKVIPPELLRFLMTRTHYKRAIDFDPRGYTIADLFDEYDRCAKEFWQHGRKSDLGRIFELSQVSQPLKTLIFLPRFRLVATYIQMPNINIKAQFEQEKGSKLSAKEERILNQRIKYAQIWLDGFAPEDFLFKVQLKLPKEAQKLSLKQREYLAEVAILMKKSWKDEKQLENGLYEVARKLNFPSTEAFKAIYLIFLGKPHGPKAAPFLLAQEKKFLVRRFKEATV